MHLSDTKSTDVEQPEASQLLPLEESVDTAQGKGDVIPVAFTPSEDTLKEANQMRVDKYFYTLLSFF